MKTLRFILFLLVGIMLADSSQARTPAAREKKPSADAFPAFDDVSTVVQKHFAANRGYRQGDLLTARSVAALFAKLEKINWKVVDRKEILKSVLPDSDWLVRQLSTRNGKEFMREVADLPGGYDRIDRLRRMPHGERQLADLIRTPDGSKMIEYMTTTQGGKNLGKMLTEGVNGRDFNKSTGRIYTELDLLKRLKKSYDAAVKQRLSSQTSETQKVDEQPKKNDSGEPKKSEKPSQTPPRNETDPFERKLPKSELPHG